jgi:hypothetical protein
MYCNTHVRFWPEGRCLDCDALAVEQKQRALRETLERAETQRQVAVPEVDPYEERLNYHAPDGVRVYCVPFSVLDAARDALKHVPGVDMSSLRERDGFVEYTFKQQKPERKPEPLRLADFVPVDYEGRPEKYAGCLLCSVPLEHREVIASYHLPADWDVIWMVKLHGLNSEIFRSDVERVAQQNEISLRDAAGALAGAAWRELVGEPQCQEGVTITAVDYDEGVVTGEPVPCEIWAQWSDGYSMSLVVRDDCPSCGSTQASEVRINRVNDGYAGIKCTCGTMYACSLEDMGLDGVLEDEIPPATEKSDPIAALKAAGWTLDEVNRAVLSVEVKP